MLVLVRKSNQSVVIAASDKLRELVPVTVVDLLNRGDAVH
jgi:hypothetical protein